MAREIADICTGAAQCFRDLGADITDEIPDFAGALDGFQALRAVLFAAMMEPVLAEHRNRIAPQLIGNIERGFNHTSLRQRANLLESEFLVQIRHTKKPVPAPLP